MEEITQNDLCRIDKIKRKAEKTILSVTSTGSTRGNPVQGPTAGLQHGRAYATTERTYTVHSECPELREGDILELEYTSKFGSYIALNYKVVDHADLK